LVNIQISCCEVSENLNIFSHLTKLERLDLGIEDDWPKDIYFKGKINNDFRGSLKSLENCKNLKLLCISNQPNVKGGLEYLPTENLESFGIQNTKYEEILEHYIRLYKDEAKAVKEWQKNSSTAIIAKLDKSNELLFESDKKNISLQKQLEETENQKILLTSQKQKLEEDIIEYEKRIAETRKIVFKLQDENEKAQQTINDLEKRRDECLQKAEELAKSLLASEQERVELEKIKEKHERLEAERKELTNSQEDLEKKIDSLEKEITEYIETIEKLEKERKMDEEKLQEIAKLNGLLTIITIEETKIQLQSVKEQLIFREERLDAYFKNYERVNEILKEKSSEKDEYLEEIAKIKSETNQIRETINEKEATIRRQEREKENRRLEKEQIEKERDSLRAERDKLQIEKDNAIKQKRISHLF
jgi:chromosome segregation ATPase